MEPLEPKLLIILDSSDVPAVLAVNATCEEPLALEEPFEPSPALGEATTAFIVRLTEAALKTISRIIGGTSHSRLKPLCVEVIDGKTRVRIEAHSADDATRLCTEARKILRTTAS